MSAKQYVDCGVQTDLADQASVDVQADMHAGSLCRMIAAVDIRGESSTLSELMLSPRLRHPSGSPPVEDQSAYMDQTLDSLPGTGDDDSAEITTTIREYKRQQIGRAHV